MTRKDHMFYSLKEKKVHYTLRVAVAMCFIGHGSFGIITKAIWCNYFAVVGIGHDLAYRLMPLLGVFDIFLGIAVLFYPLRVIPAWLVIWGFVTALLRPFSGEPLAEFIERAGNFGTPLALLLLSGGRLTLSSLFMRLDQRGGAGGGAARVGIGNPASAEKNMRRVIRCLQIVVFLILIGHGWLNLMGKKGLTGQYSSLGFSHPLATAHTIGLCEIIAACSVWVHPRIFRPLLLLIFFWKMLSECFYPHYELFEWIERGGSYGAMLALWFALESRYLPNHRTFSPIRAHA